MLVSALVIMLSLPFMVLALFRQRIAYFTFIFMLPFMPRYIGIAIGTGSFSLKRIMVLLLLTGIVFSVFTQPEKWQRAASILSKWGLFLALVVLLYTVKLVSTVSGSGVANLLYWGDDFLLFLVTFLLTIRFVDSIASFRTLLLVLLSSLLIADALAAIEFLFQRPLLQGVDSEVFTSRDIRSTGIFRDEAYRAMALFDNPLLLSQFVVSVLPLLISLFMLNFSKKALNIAMIFSVCAIILTGSRAGLLILTLSVVMYVFMYAKMKLVRPQKKIIAVMMICFAAAGMMLLGNAIKDPRVFIEGFEFSSGESSVYARLMQYVVVFDLVSVKPLLGYGMMPNFAGLEELDGLDNYYLRLALEGGVTILVLFFLLMFYSFKILYKQISNPVLPLKEKKVFIFLYLSLFAYLINGLFVSMPNNIAYLYLFLALIFVLHPKSRFEKRCSYIS